MLCVASTERAPGTSIPGTMLKGARWPPCCNPSAAASFMGCSRAMITPLWSPVPSTMRPATIPVRLATLMERKAILRLRCLMRNQQLTPITNTAPVSQPLDTVCKNLTTAVGESATAAKSFISLRTVSGLNAMPTGCCIQALATNIHQAEMVAPKPVNHVEAR